MTHIYDGYEIAESDLALRGPGDFFSGICNSEMRQSGGFHLRLAQCCDDPSLMNTAFHEASELIHSDPALLSPEHAPVRAELSYYFNSTENSVS
jgi:RecG-like helicase